MCAVNSGAIELKDVKKVQDEIDNKLKKPRQVFKDQARFNPKHTKKIMVVEDLLKPVLPEGKNISIAPEASSALVMLPDENSEY